MIRIEAVDASTASDDTLRTIASIEETCAPGDWPSEHAAVSFMRFPPRSSVQFHWLAFDGDEPIGMLRLQLPDGDPLAWTNLRVLPGHRRRGVGRALLALAVERAGGRPIAGHHESPEGAAFARAVGASDEQRNVRSRLDLKSAAFRPAVVPDGYALRSWTGATPDEIVESFASARNAIDDAPHPLGQTLSGWTAEDVRALEHAMELRGREIRVTVALAGREVVAFTELRTDAAPAPAASTEDTATVAEHRGRGLSLAVKTESLSRLRTERPDVETVSTLNAEDNAAMRAVNTKLGFVPVLTRTTAVLRLT